MVFRGKPSKACERCRERRLRCNFHRPSCGACLRAGVACSGYRDTETIRIKDQTDFVTSKALGQSVVAQAKQDVIPLKLRHLPQDLQVLGRDMFFAYYVADFSRTWEFVYQYSDPSKSPEHVSLGIDAASLAFLAHQVSSQTAHEMSRRKYGEALRKINKVLQDPESAKASSTFEAVLLLDLFEKIMKSSLTLSASRHAHIEGALALVKLRGVETFTESAELKALMGFTLDATICALTTGRYIPQIIRDIREHAAPFVDTSYPKWKLGGLMLEVCDLGAEMRCGILTSEERISRCRELDGKLKRVGLEAGPAWHFDRKFVSGHDPRAIVPDGFFPLYDTYPNRVVTQMWNTLRLTRILLCEEIIASCASSSDPESATHSEEAEFALTAMIREICASVPQMTNCDYAALHKLSRGAQTGPGAQHTHSMSHNFDVYVLIFSLYIVAWARHCPPAAHDWTVKQLHHIADHFGIKEAALILDILETQEPIQHVESCSPSRSLGPITPNSCSHVAGLFSSPTGTCPWAMKPAEEDEDEDIQLPSPVSDSFIDSIPSIPIRPTRTLGPEDERLCYRAAGFASGPWATLEDPSVRDGVLPAHGVVDFLALQKWFAEEQVKRMSLGTGVSGVGHMEEEEEKEWWRC